MSVTALRARRPDLLDVPSSEMVQPAPDCQRHRTGRREPRYYAVVAGAFLNDEARITMKAVYFEQFGGPDVLQYGDLPDPVAAPGEVVVDVAAASVNGRRHRSFAAAEMALRHAQAKFPLIPGRDFSGVIASLGEGVSDLKVGDPVFGVIAAGREGTYCEKIAVQAAIIGRKPPGLSDIDAAALALTGLTAIDSLEHTLQLKRGETILIQGWGRRRRRLRHPTRQSSRRPRDHDDECGEHRLRAWSRRR